MNEIIASLLGPGARVHREAIMADFPVNAEESTSTAFVRQRLDGMAMRAVIGDTLLAMGGADMVDMADLDVLHRYLIRRLVALSRPLGGLDTAVHLRRAAASIAAGTAAAVAAAPMLFVDLEPRPSLTGAIDAWERAHRALVPIIMADDDDDKDDDADGDDAYLVACVRDMLVSLGMRANGLLEVAEVYHARVFSKTTAVSPSAWRLHELTLLAPLGRALHRLATAAAGLGLRDVRGAPLFHAQWRRFADLPCWQWAAALPPLARDAVTPLCLLSRALLRHMDATLLDTDTSVLAGFVAATWDDEAARMWSDLASETDLPLVLERNTPLVFSDDDEDLLDDDDPVRLTNGLRALYATQQDADGDEDYVTGLVWRDLADDPLAAVGSGRRQTAAARRRLYTIALHAETAPAATDAAYLMTLAHFMAARTPPPAMGKGGRLKRRRVDDKAADKDETEEEKKDDPMILRADAPSRLARAVYSYLNRNA